MGGSQKVRIILDAHNELPKISFVYINDGACESSIDLDDVGADAKNKKAHLTIAKRMQIARLIRISLANLTKKSQKVEKSVC